MCRHSSCLCFVTTNVCVCPRSFVGVWCFFWSCFNKKQKNVDTSGFTHAVNSTGQIWQYSMDRQYNMLFRESYFTLMQHARPKGLGNMTKTNTCTLKIEAYQWVWCFDWSCFNKKSKNVDTSGYLSETKKRQQSIEI
jgi:hypothetical protein